MLKLFKYIYYKICEYFAKLYCQSSLYNKYTQPVIDFQNDVRRLLEIEPDTDLYCIDIILLFNKKKYKVMSFDYKLTLFNKVKNNYEKFCTNIE